MNKLEEAMEAHWGKRCPDYEQDCPCCEAWDEYDEMKITIMDYNEREDEMKRFIVVIEPTIIYAESYTEAWEQAKEMIEEAAHNNDLKDYLDVQIIKNKEV